MLKKTVIIASLTSSIFANTISFSDAYNLALKNNQELKAKKTSINSASLDVSTASGYNYGTLTFNENIARSNNALNVFGMKLMSREATFGDFGFRDFLGGVGNVMNASNGNFANFTAMMNNPNTQEQMLKTAPDDLNNPGYRNNFETKLVYELPLFTGFKLSSAKDMAQLQVVAAKAKFNHDEKQLGLEVLKAYNGAVAAKYFIYATMDAKKATNSFVNFATEMHNEGYVTSIDVKQAQVYDMKINSMLLEAKNKHSLAIAYLKFLTSSNTITDVKDFMNINVDTMNLRVNVNNRDDFKWMSANTNTMKKKIDFEKSASYPMIGAHFEYGFNDDKLNNIDSSKDYVTGAVGLEYKIFEGFKTQNAIKKAKLDYIKTNYYLQHMKNGIKLQVEKAILTLKTKQSVLKEKIKASNMENEVVEQSNEMYKNQLLKMSDLLMQQAKAQKARAEVIMAKYEATIAAAQLKLALGSEIFDSHDKEGLHSNVTNTNKKKTAKKTIEKENKKIVKSTEKIIEKQENEIVETPKTSEQDIPTYIEKITSTQEEVNQNNEANYIVVRSDSNVREEPFGDAKVIYTLKYKTKLFISYCNEYKWCQINNKDEYISLTLLKKLSK